MRIYYFNCKYQYKNVQIDEITCTVTLSFAYNNVNDRNLVSLSLEVVVGIPFLF